MKNIDKIINGIMAVVYSPEVVDKKKILMVSKYTERTRVNLILLKFFLEEMNMRGIFITIDRPHQYIEYLLNLHGISQKKLIKDFPLRNQTILLPSQITHLERKSSHWKRF